MKPRVPDPSSPLRIPSKESQTQFVDNMNVIMPHPAETERDEAFDVAIRDNERMFISNPTPLTGFAASKALP